MPQRSEPGRRRGSGSSGRVGHVGDGGEAGRGDRRVRSALGGERIEGRQAVRALLAAGKRPVRRLWLAEHLEPAAILDEIIERARMARVPVELVDGERLHQVAATDAPQGVVAAAAPLPEARLGDLAAGRPDGPPPFLVVCDRITDPHNLGAILRSAECAGATGAVLPRHRSAHVTAAVAKSAAGAVEYLPIAVVSGIPAALARLSEEGIWTVGLDAAATTKLWDLQLASEPIAIVLGSEGTGLARLTKARCQMTVAIPQKGAIASLNVSAAAALACFEVSRVREFPASR